MTDQNILLREDGYPNAPAELSDGEIYAIPSHHHLLPINIGDKTFDVPIAVHLHIVGLSMRLEEALNDAARYRWLRANSVAAADFTDTVALVTAAEGLNYESQTDDLVDAAMKDKP